MKPSVVSRVSKTKMTRALIALTAACGAAAVTTAVAAWPRPSVPSPNTSGPAVPVVVELFTSEGCSSCPPADDLLIDLAAHARVTGAQVIALSEHVDYWDNLGWRDPFSSHSFTDRQDAYTRTTGELSSYTPQMIVDGRTAFVGSDRSAALAAITHAAATPKAPMTLSWTSVTGGQPLSISITLAANPASAGATIIGAITEDGLRNTVTRGENAGHTIAHTSVVRRLADIGQAGKDGSFSLRTPMSIDNTWNTRNLRFVVFAQSSKTRAITSANAIAWPGSSR